eukprot:CAMPEP_0183364886 /NCGR_PEP_ID=MMETSP0164_2-20130417/82419_1 /TAXON_ID=221442 /ORGANISM="Coccolithus pelagicus ssp braarudi, Strain PLY182g" /LENGTH=47 /DNA_ID= /DNA_START= /DNA_END= /DNA_ORIENTATION=
MCGVEGTGHHFFESVQIDFDRLAGANAKNAWKCAFHFQMPATPDAWR